MAKKDNNKIITSLETLSDDEMDAVARLIGKFSRRKENPQPELEKRIDKSPSRRDHSDDDHELEVERPRGRKNPRRRVVTEDSEPRESSSSGRGRTTSRHDTKQGRNKTREGQRGRGVAARTEAVTIDNRVNKFLTMKGRNGRFADEAKGDTAIDKKLWENRHPTERPDEFKAIEVCCKICNRYFDINPNLVLVDDETGEVNFTCDNCVPRGR
jgi:hypothetical protein